MQLLIKCLMAVAMVGAGACTSTPTIYPEHALSDQILKVRLGHDGKLTNRTVAGYDATGKPIEKIMDYSLKDNDFRETANRMNFICNIGGKRFKICTDKPGFCRFSHAQKCLFGNSFCRDGELLEEYLPVEKYGFLLDANARCAKKEKYDLWANQ